MTPQQRADELLADYQAQRNIEQVMEAIAKAERDVAFYERLILRLEGAVWEIKKHFADPRMTTVWADEIEVCRDVLSRLLDKAEGKLK